MVHAGGDGIGWRSGKGEAVQRRSGYNPKRRLIAADAWPLERRTAFAQQLAYGGNPEHKKRPNDYGLTPPMNPRPGKTLCDAFGPLPKRDALLLLKNGAMKGMMSERLNGEMPQNIWAVSDQGLVYEAQVENAAQCTYHGYPMPSDDDFRAVILGEWPLR